MHTYIYICIYIYMYIYIHITFKGLCRFLIPSFPTTNLRYWQDDPKAVELPSKLTGVFWMSSLTVRGGFGV